MQVSDARKKELARIRQQKKELEHQIEQARLALVEQVKSWGFFNPFWQQEMDEISDDIVDWDEVFSEAARSWGSPSGATAEPRSGEDIREVENPEESIRIQTILLHVDNWVKIMEADLLRYELEPIEVIESIRAMLLRLPPDIQESARLKAELHFQEKHPGYLPEDKKSRLTTTALKACWLEETWYIMATANGSSHINRFRTEMQGWMFRPIGRPQHFVVFANTEDKAKELARQFVVDQTDSSSFDDWVQVNTECLGKTFTQGKAVEILADTIWVKLIEGMAIQGIHPWHDDFKSQLAKFSIETFYLVKKDESQRILSNKELMH
jgi:hypothetical protein